MITYVVTDLFKSPARVLVNTVNTMGVMGKGIAKDYKLIYPEMFTKYQQYCERKQLKIGNLWLYKTSHKWILNFPTKDHWRYPSKPEFIEEGLKKFTKTYHEKGITSISFPMLGCGNGGLDWENVVKPLMEKYLSKLPIDIYIHLYRKDPFNVEHRSIKDIKKWLRSQPESLAYGEVWDDLKSVFSCKNQFETLDSHKSFTISIVEDTDICIKIVDSDNCIIIYENQLLDFWQHLRSVGFSMTSSLPFGLEGYSSYIVSIFKELPYVKPVLMSKQSNDSADMDIGLQLIPRADYSQDSFFSISAEVNNYE